MATATLSKQTSKLPTETKVYLSGLVNEILTDPDFGLELSEKAKKRLRQALSRKQTTASFEEIKKKYS